MSNMIANSKSKRTQVRDASAIFTRGKGRKPRKSPGNQWVTGAKNLGAGAMEAIRQIREVRKMLNVEEKVFDQTQDAGASTLPANGIVTPLSLVAEGADFNNRDGDSIKCTGIWFNMLAVANAASTVFNGQSLRVILFKDSDSRGATPAVGDLLQDATNGQRAITSPINHVNGNRFTIYFDEVVHFGNSNSGSTSSPPLRVQYTFYKPISHHIYFSGTTGVIANAREGTIFVCYFTDQTANFPTLTYQSRLMYVDN